MSKLRLLYGILIVATIISGLLSRRITGIPLFIGDILWALMVYLMVRFLFMTRPVTWLAVVSLLFCYAIECSQLYQAPWINNIRHTLIGGLILGETFLWGDLLCYTVGVAVGAFIDRLAKLGQR